MIDLKGYERVFSALPAGVERAEVNAERIRRTSVHIRDGAPASGEAYDLTKYYVRAGAEKLGMIYTERGDAEEDVRRAADNARLAGDGTAAPMNGAGTRVFASPEEEGPPASCPDLTALGAACEKKLREGAEVLDLAVTVTHRETRTVNSLGLDASSRDGWAEMAVRLSVPREKGPAAEAEANISAPLPGQIDPEAFALKALRLAQQTDGGGLAPVRLSGGVRDCVMTGQVMRNILMTAWRAFSAEAMQKGASCFRRTGERIGSPAVDLVNAPSHPLSGKKWPLDSEGTPMKETGVVRKGILTEPLYTLASAAQAGAASNGCAGRVPVMTGNVPIALTTVPGMMYLAPDPGNAREDLIAALGDGIVLTYSLDLFHSVNIASGTFSVPCGGYLVRDGRPAGSLSQLTVAGSLGELFSAVEKVGNDLDFDDFYFRNYCIGSPSALLRGMHFSA